MEQKHAGEVTLIIENGILQTVSGETGHLVLPEGIRAIRARAFKNCKWLQSVVLPEGLKEIKNRAFLGCRSLEHVVFPDSLSRIGEGAFAGTALTEVCLPQLRVLRRGTFARCKALRKAEFSSMLKTIEDSAFWECEALESVVLPPKMKKIGEYAFEGCRSLREIELPDGLKVIEKETFSRCEALRELRFPECLEEIGSSAFYGCKDLQSVRFGKCLHRIGSQAFEGCGLKEILLHADGQDGELVLCDGSFKDCRQLADVTFLGDRYRFTNAFSGTPWLASRGDFLRKGNRLLLYQGQAEKIRLPEWVEEIGDGAFLGSSLVSVEFPENLRSVGARAFQGCGRLTAVSFPASLRIMGDYAFARCEALQEAVFSDGPEKIGREIADIITMITGSDDVAVTIEACHSCVTARGIKKTNTKTYTAELRGQFRTDPAMQFYIR